MECFSICCMPLGKLPEALNDFKFSPAKIFVRDRIHCVLTLLFRRQSSIFFFNLHPGETMISWIFCMCYIGKHNGSLAIIYKFWEYLESFHPKFADLSVCCFFSKRHLDLFEHNCYVRKKKCSEAQRSIEPWYKCHKILNNNGTCGFFTVYQNSALAFGWHLVNLWSTYLCAKYSRTAAGSGCLQGTRNLAVSYIHPALCASFRKHLICI